MRRAIIQGSDLEEEPIRYSLVQSSGYVALDATVGTLTQTLLLLYPDRIRKTSWVSAKIGLPTNGTYEAIVIEE